MLPDRREIAEELQALADSHGGFLQPVDVVQAASPPDAPLHKYFTWDEAKAAHAHRLHQARQLLRVTVLVRRGPEKVYLPVFTSLSTDRGRDGEGYRATHEVRADPVLSIRADIDVLLNCERLLTRANSPRLTSILHAVALTLADLEVDFGGRRPAPAEEGVVLAQ